MREERIDSHHHLWKYSGADYPWMLNGMEAIRRDFLVEDLRLAMQAGAIDGVVTVQARQSLAETEWLLDLASGYPFMRGIVGWVPLTDPALPSQLEKYAANPKLKAVRHVLHDEPDDFYLLREDFNRGIARLKDFGLRYDILIFERHLPQTIEFVDRHPQQLFIVDHVAKPKIRDHRMSPWRERMRDLARRENVYCKLSGMVTEANWKSWTEADLRPFIDVVLGWFGPDRLMFGSDWPVALVACTYRRWVEVVERATESLSASERGRLFGGTAREVYGL
ncbi:MAG TPA: amidohydrolase family protein [Terriglobales bacterium]|nr:amidohydrolase family protein [Terriglobales bacterium]